jgi:hypothetical protein
MTRAGGLKGTVVAEPEQYFAFRQIVSATGSPESAIRAHWPLLATALEERGIYDRLVSIAAIATVAVESSFRPVREAHWLPDAERNAYLTRMYEGRDDLGNSQPGDGIRFAGRSFIQITGRSNYTTYGRKLGLDLVSNPDGALDPTVAARILAVYFTDHRIRWLAEPHPLMSAADLARSEEWRGVRVAVNGGENGLDLFLRVVNTLEGATMPGPLSYDPDAAVDAQPDPWSCSIQAVQWLLRAIGRNPDASDPSGDPWLRSQLVPGIVDPAVGLRNATGQQLAEWITREYGAEMGFVAQYSPVTFDDVWAGAGVNPTIVGGGNWNHWAGIRKRNDDGTLAVANPAPGWMGVGDRISRAQWDALGTFHAIWIDRASTLPVVEPPVIVPPNPDALLLAEVRADLRAILAKLDAAGIP